MDWTHGKDPGLEALACFDGLRAFRASFAGFYDRCQARAEGQCLLDCRPYFTIHWSPKNGLWVYRKLGAEFFESGPKKLRKYFYLFQDLLFGDRLHALVVAYWDMLSISREVPELIDEGGMARVLYLLMSEAKGIFDLDLTKFEHTPLPDNGQETYLGPSALMRAKGYKELMKNCSVLSF